MIMLTIVLLVLCGIVLLTTAITNPFNKYSIVKPIFIVKTLNIPLSNAVSNRRTLKLRQQLGWRVFAYVKCGLHIVASRYLFSPAAPSKTVEGIATDIHALRFRAKNQFIISGDHFSMLYLRSLGIFYYPLIDPTIPGTEADWQNRQVAYLQTLVYALSIFAKRP